MDLEVAVPDLAQVPAGALDRLDLLFLPRFVLEAVLDHDLLDITCDVLEKRQQCTLAIMETTGIAGSPHHTRQNLDLDHPALYRLLELIS
jgi:hypothetical protein